MIICPITLIKIGWVSLFCQKWSKVTFWAAKGLICSGWANAWLLGDSSPSPSSKENPVLLSQIFCFGKKCGSSWRERPKSNKYYYNSYVRFVPMSHLLTPNLSLSVHLNISPEVKSVFFFLTQGCVRLFSC